MTRMTRKRRISRAVRRATTLRSHPEALGLVSTSSRPTTTTTTGNVASSPHVSEPVPEPPQDIVEVFDEFMTHIPDQDKESLSRFL